MSKFSFQHPTTIVLAGPTQCGKTHFLIRALLEGPFQPPPQKIVWVYGEWQPAYDELRRLMLPIQFIKGFTLDLYERFRPQERNLLILDDQMENANTRKRGTNGVTKFFTQGAHHRNLTVVYLVQNLFNQDGAMRTISLNTHYIVLFKNPRDATQVRTLGYQMYPDNPGFLTAAFRDATSVPYGYLTINLHPQAVDAFRVMTNVFDVEPTVYVPQPMLSTEQPPPPRVYKGQLKASGGS